MRRKHKLETAQARIAELERELGYAEPESHIARYERELREDRERRRRQQSDSARAECAVWLYLVGVIIWNVATWGNHPALWLVLTTCAWDLPAALGVAASALTFIVWLLTGRNALGRWL